LPTSSANAGNSPNPLKDLGNFLTSFRALGNSPALMTELGNCLAAQRGLGNCPVLVKEWGDFPTISWLGWKGSWKSNSVEC
jgi:hypothetical protein